MRYNICDALLAGGEGQAVYIEDYPVSVTMCARCMTKAKTYLNRDYERCITGEEIARLVLEAALSAS